MRFPRAKGTGAQPRVKRVKYLVFFWSRILLKMCLHLVDARCTLVPPSY